MWILRLLVLLLAGATTPATSMKNVLFLLVDDLRPEIAGAYEQQTILTPNIDRLTEEGTTFRNAYCQQAICGPTRNSFLSGRRPQRTKSWNFLDSFREVGPDWISFPQWFKMHNFTTLATGKTFHPNLPPNWDVPYSWSDEEPYYFAKNAYPKCDAFPNSLVCPTDEPYEKFADWLDMNVTRSQISRYSEQFKTTGKPFFLVFGAHRPHLPWHIPRTPFWEMYGPTKNISLPTHESAPVDMPPIAFTYECDGKSNMTAFHETRPTPFPRASSALPNNMARAFRRGYFASVSWTDYLIGELLDELEHAGVENDTIVALLGDHGWQLGEHNVWGKHTNFELGVRVPMIIKSPDIKGRVVTSLVESVDMYPTISSLAGIETAPPDLDGVDLSPLIRGDVDRVKDFAFSEYPRCPINVSEPWSDRTSCVFTPRENFTAMGLSVRTPTFRYNVWLHWRGDELRGDFNRDPIGEELYAHNNDNESDFNAFENVNLAYKPEYATVVRDLYEAAKMQWGDTNVAHESDGCIACTKKSHAPPRPDEPFYRDQFEIWNDENQ